MPLTSGCINIVICTYCTIQSVIEVQNKVLVSSLELSLSYSYTACYLMEYLQYV